MTRPRRYLLDMLQYGGALIILANVTGTSELWQLMLTVFWWMIVANLGFSAIGFAVSSAMLVMGQFPSIWASMTD